MKRHLWRIWGVCACLLTSGCWQTNLDATYGTVQRPSVNGLGVFVDMLRARGRRVDILPAINDRLYRYNTFIVFHHEFDPLSKATEEFLNLDWDPEQTIVVALRDCDWAIDYWDQVARQLDKSDLQEAAAARRASDIARSMMRGGTANVTTAESSTLYRLETILRQTNERARKVQYLSSNGSLAGELDVDFLLRRRLAPVPSSPSQVLWKSGDDPLLISVQKPDGPRILILGTTAPLLNAGLVHPGNRELTRRFMAELDDTEPIAVVTSSILLEGGDENISLWRFAKVYPHPWILGQSLLAIILFCWWRWPIFGRPHADQVQETKRFGRHVAAVGQLLAVTGNVNFALQRIQEWQRVQPEHRKGRRG